MFFTLPEIKAHLNIDKDFHDDDAYLLRLITVAEDAISKRIDRNLDRCVNPKTGYLPPSISQAILLLIGQLYANREATSPVAMSEIPIGFEFLCNLNKHYEIP